MSGSSSSNGGGGFGAKFEHFLYSGDKKHVVAGMAIIGSLFGVPWYFMNRGNGDLELEGVCHFAEKDYYDLLGVSKDITREEIKKAFHALAKKYHLDANKNNPSTRRKFQEIRDAYETLQDPDKRKQYDMCAKQVGATECGYYVMKYMFEILSKEAYEGMDKIVERVGSLSYNQQEIDEVRDTWAKYFIGEWINT